MEKTSLQPNLGQYDNNIQVLRTQINLLDEQIVSLLKERLQLVVEAREIKQIDMLPQHSVEREQVVIENVTSGSQGLERQYLEEIYRTLLATTRVVADQKV